MKLSKLIENLQKERIRLEDIAKDLNISRTTLYNLIYEGRDIKLSLAIKIVKYFSQKVTCEEIYNEFIKKPKSK